MQFHDTIDMEISPKELAGLCPQSLARFARSGDLAIVMLAASDPQMLQEHSKRVTAFFKHRRRSEALITPDSED
jgi:hypothetical protein